MIKVLVCNDDGIEAEGLRKLVLSLANFAKVYVFAPSEQQSGMSMSLTLSEQLRVMGARVPGAEEAFAVVGTPAMCTTFGLRFLEERGIKIDYVVSGINHGANLGNDVHYSGTVGGAMTASLMGYKSIALSVVSHEASHFDYICDMIPELMKLSDEAGPGYVISANAPDIPSWEVKGVRMVGTGNHGYNLNYEKNGDDHELYDLKDISMKVDENESGTDIALIREGYATVTPLKNDLTDHRMLAKLNRITTDKVLCIFIDFQEKLMPAMRKADKVLDRAARFARCAKELGLPTIVTQQYSRGLGATVPEIHEALNGVYEKVEKVTFSCLDNEDFAQKIDAAQGKAVVLCGVEAHICVQQTALDFLKFGYKVIVLKDCCSSRRKEDFNTAMDLMASKGCTITTYEAFVYDMLESSKNKHFKAISKIVTE